MLIEINSALRPDSWSVTRTSWSGREEGIEMAGRENIQGSSRS